MLVYLRLDESNLYTLLIASLSNLNLAVWILFYVSFEVTTYQLSKKGDGFKLIIISVGHYDFIGYFILLSEETQRRKNGNN